MAEIPMVSTEHFPENTACPENRNSGGNGLIMKSRIGKIILVLLVILILFLGIGWAMLGTIVRHRVERDVTKALGVETTVDAASLNPLKGCLRLNGLTITNPEGFRAAYFTRVDNLTLHIKPLSVFTGTIRLPELELDGVEVNIEQKISGGNTSKILANLKEFKRQLQREKPGKGVELDRVVIKNIVAHFRLPTALGMIGTQTIKIDQIELTDISSDDVRGMMIAEITSQIFPAVLATVFNKAKGIIPDDALKEMTLELAGFVKDLGVGGVGIIKQVGGEIGGFLSKGAEKTVGKLGKTIVKGVGSGVKKLFGGNKKEAEDSARPNQADPR